MVNFIRRIIFKYRFRKAVKDADYNQHLTHRKHMVIVVAGKLQVISKQDVRKLIKQKIFRPGTTIQDIEQRALYVTL